MSAHTGKRTNLVNYSRQEAVKAGTRMGLADVFAEASEHLDALLQECIGTLGGDDSEHLAASSLTVEQSITGYLHDLDKAANEASSEDAALGALSQALKDEGRKEKALNYIQKDTDDDHNTEWIRQRATMTVTGIKESLWEVVVSGRELRLFVTTDSATHDTKVWKDIISNGFRLAGGELDEALTWLKKPEHTT